MSAGLLREAAALMRERAEAATCGPWKTYVDTNDDPVVFDQYGTGVQSDGSHDVVCYSGQVYSRDANHIASWHPAVAHAVAGFLEAIAHRQASGSDLRWPHPEDVEWAEQIARAYLGRDA